MVDPDIIDYRVLTDPELAAVVLQLRKERGWTQETLAELSRISPRTVQRLEDGQPSSVETRRAVAGAFDFADLDTFNNPWPMPNIEKLKKESARIERETVSVPIAEVSKGKQLRELAEQCDTYLLTSVDDANDEAEALMAALEEYFVEYGDCHDLYTPTGKLEVNQHFQNQIDELMTKGIALVAGRRRVRLRFDHQPDDPGTVFEAAYIVSGPASALPKSIRVPRNDRMGF